MMLLVQLPEAINGLVTRNPRILGGRAVFLGTRVPIATLFEYLSDGLSLQYFLDSFPSVSKQQAKDVLHMASRQIEDAVQESK
jgi:uncharacterized protein (DUF433 family)